MKPLILTCVLITVGIAHGQVAEADRTLLAREFKREAPTVLDHPFSGMLQVVWPKDKKSAKQERVRLNLLRPADSGNGHSPIDTPYLATTEDGKSYWGAFALREKLPSAKDLTSFSTYTEIVDLLGAPTHLPFSGETDDKWAYDTVCWRLFAPLSVGSIEILEISVARKSPIAGGRSAKYLIDSYSVRRGTLTKSEQVGAGQPATRPESDSEGSDKPQPESDGRSR